MDCALIYIYINLNAVGKLFISQLLQNQLNGCITISNNYYYYYTQKLTSTKIEIIYYEVCNVNSIILYDIAKHANKIIQAMLNILLFAIKSYLQKKKNAEKLNVSKQETAKVSNLTLL